MDRAKKSSFFRREGDERANGEQQSAPEQVREPRAPRAPRAPREGGESRPDRAQRSYGKDDRAPRSYGKDDRAPRAPRAPKPDWVKKDGDAPSRSAGRPYERSSERSDERPARRGAGRSEGYGAGRPDSRDAGRARGAGRPDSRSAGRSDSKTFSKGAPAKRFGDNQIKGGSEQETFGGKKFAPRSPRKTTTKDGVLLTQPAVKAAPKSAEGPVRLNRFIAQSGVCSRREADELISSGAITVNGVVVTELGSKVDTKTDVVEFEGKKLSGEKFVYIIMNKPKGYVTSVEDPHNEDTVITLLKGKVKERVYPVGRLDKNTTGVLLLTNDGALTETLTHPSYERRKIYHVFLDKPCTEEHLELIAKGVELEDGEIHADEISYVEGNRKEVGIEIHSGRNRIVRRIFESLDYNVVKLDRVFFAGFSKMGLRRGFWRYLTPVEIMTLKNDK